MAPRDIVIVGISSEFSSWFQHFDADPTNWTIVHTTPTQIINSNILLTDFDAMLLTRLNPDFNPPFDTQASDFLPFVNAAMAAGVVAIFGPVELFSNNDPVSLDELRTLVGVCERTISYGNNYPNAEVIDFSHAVTSDMLSVDPGGGLWDVRTRQVTPPEFAIVGDLNATLVSGPHKDFEIVGTVLAKGNLSGTPAHDGHPLMVAIEPTDTPANGAPAFPVRIGLYCGDSIVRGYPCDFLLERLVQWALGDFDNLPYPTGATWDSQPVDMSSVGIIGSSLVQWDDVLPAQTSAVVLISIDGGPFLQATNGGPVPGLVDGVTDMDGVTLTTRIFLQTSDPQATPQMDKVVVTVFGQNDQLPERTGWYSGGFVEWITGPNAGRKLEVLSWDLDTHKVILFLPTPNVIIPGDEFKIAPGCDKTPFSAEGCRDKWDNMINFRGEPHVPSLDRISSVPDSALQGLGGKK